MDREGEGRVRIRAKRSLVHFYYLNVGIYRSECAEKLNDEFAPKRPNNFFTAKVLFTVIVPQVLSSYP